MVVILTNHELERWEQTEELRGGQEGVERTIKKRIPLEGDEKSQILKMKEEKVGNFHIFSRRTEAVAGVFTAQMSSPITQNGVLSDFKKGGSLLIQQLF